MRLTKEEREMLRGDRGPACREALTRQMAVGGFFGAKDFVRVRSAHVHCDMEAVDDPGLDYIEALAASGAQCVIPLTTDPRSVDFAFAGELKQDPALVRKEQRLVAALLKMGAVPCNTCITYQSVDQPVFGEHLAWGDTGVVIYANAVGGARSNYEGGPSAIWAALTGRTPRYGYHLDACRRGTVRVDLQVKPRSVSDWGAVGCLVGRRVNDYWQVPVLTGVANSPTPDALKHLGAALASYGSLAMFHLVGITPEARTLTEAFGGKTPPRNRLVVTARHLHQVYDSFVPEKSQPDVIVFGTPQLSLYEIRELAALFKGRQVKEGVTVLLTTNRFFKDMADQLGYTATITASGAKVLTGVCFYLMAARELARRNGFRTLLTDSAKLANTVAGYGYNTVFRPTAACVEAAVAGRVLGG